MYRLQISVSIIEPGYVQTPLAAKQLGDNAPWRQADAQKRRFGAPGGRWAGGTGLGPIPEWPRGWINMGELSA